MRTIMFIIAGIALAFVGLQVWSTVSTKGTPQQPYEVIERRGELEVRRYPEALSAMVERSGATYKEVANSGFRSLAGYIFGGNEGERKIAMTAPVHMELGPDRSTMRFIMPEGLTMDSLPRPNDPDVLLERMPEEVVAALRFSGFAGDERIREHADRLLSLLAEAGLEPMGTVRFLGYDPPWQLAARRNEVVVAVRW